MAIARLLCSSNTKKMNEPASDFFVLRSVLMSKLVKRCYWLDKAEKRARELDLDLWGCSATSSDLIHRLEDQKSRSITLGTTQNSLSLNCETKPTKERKTSNRSLKSQNIPKKMITNQQSDITSHFRARKFPKEQSSLWDVVRSKMLKPKNSNTNSGGKIL